jgi:hypothetical protein
VGDGAAALRTAPRSHDARPGAWATGLVLAFLLIVTAFAVPAARGAYATAPEPDWSRFVPALTAPSALAPGSQGTIVVSVANPLAQALSPVALSLEEYAFNPPTGNAVGTPPDGAAPTIGTAGALAVNLTGPSLPPSSVWNATVPVAVPSSAPDGAYAIRLSLAFTAAGAAYLFESRGFFSAAAWAAATTGPNGTPTINASLLGVSGVIPETAILVHASTANWVLYGLLAVGLVLAGVGAYWWGSSGPGSTSGARRGAAPQRAPRAFGKRRSKDGD